MAKLRKFISYRRLERPYTRRSKFRAKSFIKANPVRGVVRFIMGEPSNDKKFPFIVMLKSKQNLQVRNFALESGRQSANRVLEKGIGKVGYRMMVKVYPHHVLRENPLAAGAGADRMSTGMAHSFGKPIGLAARVHEDQIVCQIECEKQHLDLAQSAMRRFRTKIPGGYFVEVTDNSKKMKA